MFTQEIKMKACFFSEKELEVIYTVLNEVYYKGGPGKEIAGVNSQEVNSLLDELAKLVHV